MRRRRDRRRSSWKRLARNLSEIARSGFQMSWSADSAGEEPHDIFNASAAFSSRLCPARWIEHTLIESKVNGERYC